MTSKQEAETCEFLKTLDLFSRLDGEELKTVARLSQMANLPRGTVIFRENEYSRVLYAVREGEVLITQHNQDEDDVSLAQYNPGDVFGAMEMFQNIPRRATAITMKDTLLLEFPFKNITFHALLVDHPHIVAQIFFKHLASVSRRFRQAHKMIKEKEPWMQNLRRELHTDKLTGLPNMIFLRDEYQNRLPELGGCTSLLMIKPDRFKDFNDRFGHEAGDKLLMLMAIFLESTLRINDILTRYRGDEFTLLLPGTEQEQAIALSQEIGEALYDMDITEITGGRAWRLTVSMGLGSYPAEGKDIKSLIDTAYERLYQAWRMGGNRLMTSQESPTE